MRIAMFYHSLVSDWNHGNAHFLRGVATELIDRGHDVRIFEPANGWSLQNLISEHGQSPVDDFHEAYPTLRSQTYDPTSLDLDAALEGVDLVLVHEWSDPALVRRIGQHRAASRRYRLLFHDTHHRAFTQPNEMAKYDLTHFDGVLAYGQVLTDLYLKNRWTRRAWTWHEAADVKVFRPTAAAREGDLVWVGNWGDEERTAELREYLVEPVKTLGLRSRIYGVRYPDAAQAELKAAGIDYRGWLANYRAPAVFASFALTVHVMRRPYVEALPGIPTIRVFEALACGIPLVCSPWDDRENLFSPGEDFLVARDGQHMTCLLRRLLADPDEARQLAERGRQTILARHTCSHRVEELLQIAAQLDLSRPARTRRNSPCGKDFRSHSSDPASFRPTGTARRRTTAGSSGRSRIADTR